MQNLNDKTIDALRSLIVINNDRYEGYKTAASETKDADLKVLFTGFSEQSNMFSKELENLLPADVRSKESPKDSTKLSGKIYRVWMDIKSAITAKDRHAVLSSCEFGEDAALKAYNEVLDKKADLSPEVLQVITRQKEKVQEGHNKVKQLRDLQKQD